MKKIIVLSRFALFAGLLLTSCALDNSIRLFINEYGTYESMINDYLKLDENFNEPDLFYNDISFNDLEILNTSYYIGGTDYCINEGKISSYKNHDPNHCDSLHNREMFVVYRINDESSFVIIYQTKVLDEKFCEWNEETNGNAYSYESRIDNFNSPECHNLKNINGDKLLATKFKNIDGETKSRILEQIANYYRQIECFINI